MIHPQNSHRALPQLDGVIVLDKPSGPTSARCLNALKMLGQKKIGHAGTLDPMARGVLLALLGQATKISGPLLEDGGKVYSGCLELGRITDTWDGEGRTTGEFPWRHVSEEDVRREISSWQSLAEQMVPPYSAAKQNGRPLYSLARRGVDMPIRVKRVEISRAQALEISLPLARFRVACGSGTYIRSLAHSLGMRLGCGAVLTQLTREYSHPFGLDEAVDPAALLDDPGLLVRSLRPVTDALPGWRRVELGPAQAGLARQGRPVPAAASVDVAGGDRALLLESGRPIAMARLRQTPAGSCWTVTRGMWN